MEREKRDIFDNFIHVFDFCARVVGKRTHPENSNVQICFLDRSECGFLSPFTPKIRLMDRESVKSPVEKLVLTQKPVHPRILAAKTPHQTRKEKHGPKVQKEGRPRILKLCVH